MGLTNYGARTTRTRPNGTKETTSKGGEYTTKVSHQSDVAFVKGAVYRGDLKAKDHTHYEPTGDYSRGVLRSDVFRGQK